LFFGDWGLGIGDWGLGIGVWGQSPIPNPQSPSPIIYILNKNNLLKISKYYLNFFIFFNRKECNSKNNEFKYS